MSPGATPACTLCSCLWVPLVLVLVLRRRGRGGDTSSDPNWRRNICSRRPRLPESPLPSRGARSARMGSLFFPGLYLGWMVGDAAEGGKTRQQSKRLLIFLRET